MAFTTYPIFVVREVLEIPLSEPLGRVFIGDEGGGCSSSTKFFLVETKGDITRQGLEDLREQLLKRPTT